MPSSHDTCAQVDRASPGSSAGAPVTVVQRPRIHGPQRQSARSPARALAQNPAAGDGALELVRCWRYLPLSLLATALVVLMPAALAAKLVPPGGALRALAAAASAVLLSLALASLGAAAWQRWRGSRDLLFNDLMLWAWLKRCLTERRLRRVRSMYEAAAAATPAARVELLEELSKLLAARSAYTAGHCQRVARQAERIARTMRLSNAEVSTIRTAAVIHDVGKIYTPGAILNKAGALTEAEFAIVKRHTLDGAAMLSTVGDPELTAIVRHHHERLDGSGYPDRLSGAQIPLGARIIAVADTFDAITSHRPYRRARTQRQALAILHQEADSQLDGDVVDAFVSRYSARRSAAWLAFATATIERASAALQLTPAGLGAGGSVAQALPALGAAGLLALAPSARYEKPVGEHPAPTLAQRPHGAPLAPGHQYADSRATRRETRPQNGATPPVRGREHPQLSTGVGDSRGASGVVVLRDTARSTPAPGRSGGQSRADASTAGTGSTAAQSSGTTAQAPVSVTVSEASAPPTGPVGGAVQTVTSAAPAPLPAPVVPSAPTSTSTTVTVAPVSGVSATVTVGPGLDVEVHG